MGIRCLALSCVTNAAAGVLDEPIDHEKVLEVGARAAVDLVALLREVIPAIARSRDAPATKRHSETSS
jgi:purine-nucleoside phosphorylase